MLGKKRERTLHRATSTYVESLRSLPLVVTPMVLLVFACHVIQADEEVTVSHIEAL
jgi:hypothetical protein